MNLTDILINLARMPAAQIPPKALGMARLSLLDWMTCGLAGVAEPVAGTLRALAEAEGGRRVASVIGGVPVPARMAAMVNGATSHALDYDDTHFAHVGHLSVGIYPAALAVAEERDASADALIAAFAVGAEAAIRVGLVLGRAHYDRGFHQTATAGAFGATLAAGRLMGLTEAQLRAALGLCATRASGLKSQFGTMGKPYNAGIAAANGVECATLAGLGVGSAEDGLLGEQGFVDTHTAQPVAPPMGAGFLLENNSYKLHACCHGTHAMIEALRAAKAGGGVAGDVAGDLSLDRVAGLRLLTNPRWLRVCNIGQPATGLEVKFSFAWLAGMVLRGLSTSDDRAYTDALAGDAQLACFARRVEVIGDDSLTDMQVKGVLHLEDGRSVAIAHDLNAPMSSADLAGRLRAKAEALLGDRGRAVWDLAPRLERMGARALGAVLTDAGR